MSDAELSDEICSLIHSSVPTVDALELLVFLAGRADQEWVPGQPTGSAHLLRDHESPQYARLFLEQGLLVAGPTGGYRFQPATPALDSAVRALCTAYNERPVTLIRTVYAIADLKKIQSFADAFKLKKDS